MEKHNVEAKNNIKIEVNSPCPDCHKGRLLPFVRPIFKGGEYNKEFDYYEIYYRCSRCNYTIDGNSLIADDGTVF